MAELDVREIPPNERHDRIHDAFADLDPGESLTIVNDHDPKPLYYELSAEVPAFDDEAYAVEREGPERFVAELPKAASGAEPETVRLADLDGEAHAAVETDATDAVVTAIWPADGGEVPADERAAAERGADEGDATATYRSSDIGSECRRSAAAISYLNNRERRRRAVIKGVRWRACERPPPAAASQPARDAVSARRA